MPSTAIRKGHNVRRAGPRVTVTVSVPSPDLARIDAAADAVGVTRSGYIAAAAAKQAERDLRRTEAA